MSLATRLRPSRAARTVCAVVGTAWWMSAASALGGRLGAGLASAGVGVFLGLLFAGRPSQAEMSSAQTGRRRWSFAAVVCTEFIAIAAVAAAAGSTGHAHFIPPLVCGVVGVHFIALASVLDDGIYRATGALMVVAAAVTFALGPAIGPLSLAWAVVPGLSSGVVLWLTALAHAGVLPRQPARFP